MRRPARAGHGLPSTSADRQASNSRGCAAIDRSAECRWATHGLLVLAGRAHSLASRVVGEQLVNLAQAVQPFQAQHEVAEPLSLIG